MEATEIMWAEYADQQHAEQPQDELDCYPVINDDTYYSSCLSTDDAAMSATTTTLCFRHF